MGMELARLYVTITTKTSQLLSGLHAAQAQVGNAISNYGGMIAAVQVPIVAISAAVTAMGVKTAISIEAMSAELKMLIGDAQDADKTMSDLAKFKSPFRLNELFPVAQDLTILGKRGDELISTLRLLGNASGGTSGNFKTLSNVFRDVYDSNLMTSGSFDTLRRHGILTYADLKQFGAQNEKQAKAMLAANRIHFNDFLKLLQSTTTAGGRFEHAMEEQMKIVKGLWTQLVNVTTELRLLIGVPFLPFIKATIGAMTSVVASLRDIVEWGGKSAAAAISGAAAFGMFTIAAYAARIAMSAYGITFRMVLAAMKVALIGTGWGLVFVAIGAAIGYVIQKFDLLAKAGSVFSWLYNRIVIVSGIGKRLGQAWTSLGRAFSAIWEGVKQMLSGLAIIFEPWITAVRAFGDDFESVLIRVFTLLGDYILEAAEWFEAFVTSFDSLWANMPQTVAGVFSGIVDIIKNALQQATVEMQIWGAQTRHIWQDVSNSIGKAMIWAVGKARGWTAEQIADMLKSMEEEDKGQHVMIDQAKQNKAPGLFDFSEKTKELMANAGVTDLLNAKKEIEAKRNLKQFGPENKPRDSNVTGKEAYPIFPGAGMHDIGSFGKTIQEEMLKGPDTQQKMVGLLENGNTLQQTLIIESQKQTALLGLSK